MASADYKNWKIRQLQVQFAVQFNCFATVQPGNFHDKIVQIYLFLFSFFKIHQPADTFKYGGSPVIIFNNIIEYVFQ